MAELPISIVKVQYYSETKGDITGAREYSFYTEEPLSVGDIVRLPNGKGRVSAIDVPEAEIEAFKDKVKTIPANSGIAFASGGEELPSGGLAEAAAKSGAEVTVVDVTSGTEVTPKYIATVNPNLDPEVLRCITQSKELLVVATNAIVTTPEQAKSATEYLGTIAHLKRALEGRKRDLLEPFKSEQVLITDAFKVLMDPVLQADQLFRSKVLGYQTEEQRKRAEADRVAQLEREAEAARAALEGTPPPATPVPQQAPLKTNIETEAGAVAQKMITKYEVTDFAALPDEYKVADVGKLTKAVKAGGMSISIPGVRIFQEPILQVNTR